jgi:hypothetical protein
MIDSQATYHVLASEPILKAFSYVVSLESFMIYLFLVYITTLGYVLRLWDIDYYVKSLKTWSWIPVKRETLHGNGDSALEENNNNKNISNDE